VHEYSPSAIYNLKNFLGLYPGLHFKGASGGQKKREGGKEKRERGGEEGGGEWGSPTH